MSKAQNLFLKRLMIFLFAFSIILYPVEVSAKFITRTQQENHAYYRTYLENKYGYIINIDSSVLQSGGFYKSPREDGDKELRVLQDIESTFAMLPNGFVKEVNDYIKSLNGNPTLNIIYQPDSNRAGVFRYNYDYHRDGTITVNHSLIAVEDGNSFIEVLLHEFAHKLTLILEIKNVIKPLDRYFTDIANKSEFSYNEDYTRLFRMNLDHRFFDYYLSEYSSIDFWEDVAETFTYAVMQPRYISSYGDGVKKPIHDKIEMLSKTLTSTFRTLRNSDFLLNCLPDPASRWAQTAVSNASVRGITQWGTYGLNTHDITRYDAALIIRPFLYKYIEEIELFNLAGISRNQNIPQNFVFDIIDAEDIFLLDKLGIMRVNNGRFDPNARIQKQTAAIIFTRIARLFGLQEIAGADLKTDDALAVADWAISYVTFAVSMGIMGVDHRNNFNPEGFISYQEFYSALVNICRLKAAFNAQNNIKMPASQYFQDFMQGTTLASNGWIHYFNCIGLENFTGRARYSWSNGDMYEGEFLNGDFHGMGRVVFANGSSFEGEFYKDKMWNGIFTRDGVYYRLEQGEVVNT